MTLDTTVQYLIQHSETGEYLYPSSDDFSVKTQALSDSEKGNSIYQWTLDHQSSGYLIKNVSMTRLLVPSSSTTLEIPAVVDSPSPSSEMFKWKLSSEEVNKAIQITMQAQLSGPVYNLYKAPAKDVMISSTQSLFSGHESWILVSASPPKAVVSSLLPLKNPLSTGSYRIRSLNGLYLLTMPDNTQTQNHQDHNVYVTKALAGQAAKYQMWDVQLMESSGLYSILNSGTGLYLKPSSNNGLQGDFLIGTSSIFSTWTIQTTDMGVIFFIGLAGLRSLSIGFPNYKGGDLSEVELEPSDSVPSQIWFFENLALNPIVQISGAIHSTSTLKARNYYIRSCHDDQIYLGMDSDEIKLTDATKKAKFTLEYPSNDSGGFTLSHLGTDDNGDDETSYVIDAQGRLDLRDTSVLWVAIPHQGDGGVVYHICDAATGRKAISSRTVKKKKVVVDPMAATDEVQWWSFEGAT